MGKLNITSQDGKALFTQEVLAAYTEMIEPTGFLRSFFEKKQGTTLNIDISVRRGTEKIAVDVVRGSIGNRNTISRSSQRLIQPPLYREYFDITSLDIYDVEFSSVGRFLSLTEKIAENLAMLRAKVDRSYELQCSQVTSDGIVTLQSNIDIDFRRKAASIVTLAPGSYWTMAGTTPVDDIEDGCRFLRTDGKFQGSFVNVIFGASAWKAFINNSSVKEFGDLRNINLMDIREAQRNSQGGVLHKQFTAGSWNCLAWTYPEYYENSSGVMVPYVADNEVRILPERPNFILGFGATPKLPSDQREPSDFVINDYIDEREKTHTFDVESAGIAIPVAVDQAYTLIPVA